TSLHPYLNDCSLLCNARANSPSWHRFSQAPIRAYSRDSFLLAFVGFPRPDLGTNSQPTCVNTVALLCRRPEERWPSDRPQIGSIRRAFLFALPQLVKREIDDRGRVKRQDLRNDETSDDSNTERLAQFAPDAHSDSERQRTEHRSKGCHHDGAETHK